jgi:hypothetical protein
MAGTPAVIQPKPVFQVFPGQDCEGAPIYTVLVKRTYDIVPGQPLKRAAADRPIALIDEYYDHGDAETSTVMFEAEMVAFKAMTDVVFIGKAYAPEGRPVQTLDAGLQVDGSGRKLLRLTGDRRCVFRPGQSPLFTEPKPFATLDLRYDLAYGGKDRFSFPEAPVFYPRNHMGKGFVVKNMKESVHNLALPNIEDPQDLLTPDRILVHEAEGWRLQPMPQGLGWYQKTWYPRMFFAGVIPPFLSPGALTREEHLGLVPKDHVALFLRRKIPSMHPRFHNGASPGLAVPYLKGDETIRLKALTPEGMIHFRLPGETPEIRLDIGLPGHELDVVVQSVCIRGEDRQVDVIWRGSRGYPGLDWLPEMKKLQVDVA